MSAVISSLLCFSREVAYSGATFVFSNLFQGRGNVRIKEKATRPRASNRSSERARLACRGTIIQIGVELSKGPSTDDQI